jgi:2-polyprenyl-3-methyl-5-hydroxy-6-metoxy-1,4-benzoquinol methylase
MIRLPDDYVERPMAPELDLISRMHGRFKGTGLVMPEAQRKIYENITKLFVEDVKRYRGYPKHIYKPTVVDVGCGVGIGSNILSQEAEFVWGIDSNDESIRFAQQLFSRQKNNIYYTPQVTFDKIDATDEPRELMAFDYVVCVEVLEHIPRTETDKLVNFLNRFVKRNKSGQVIEDESRTRLFVTSPNRNSPHIQNDTPRNEHHCFEANASELYEYFTSRYKAVTVLNADLVPQELSTEETPLVFKLEIPL